MVGVKKNTCCWSQFIGSKFYRSLPIKNRDVFFVCFFFALFSLIGSLAVSQWLASRFQIIIKKKIHIMKMSRKRYFIISMIMYLYFKINWNREGILILSYIICHYSCYCNIIFVCISVIEWKTYINRNFSCPYMLTMMSHWTDCVHRQ